MSDKNHKLVILTTFGSSSVKLYFVINIYHRIVLFYYTQLTTIFFPKIANKF